MATPFMVDTLGSGARLQVQVAWGADPAGSPAGWTWSDITADVLQAGGRKITMTLGGADEASTTQPATCSMTLDNRAGSYSLGGQSSNWPNVRRNTPVRVRVDPSASGASYTTIFQGFADGWSPDWDVSGEFAIVSLSASGTLRRLAQGASPVVSALRRVLGVGASVCAYWPAEEGTDAEVISSGIGGPAMGVTGSPRYAASDTFPGSAPLPVLNGSSWYGVVPTYTNTGDTQVRWLIDVPTSGGDDAHALIVLRTTGTASTWAVRYRTGGDIELLVFNSGGTLLSSTIGFALDGRRGQFGLLLSQNGANVDWNMDFLEVGAAGTVGFNTTLAGVTVGVVQQVQVNFDGGNNGFVIGHVTLENAITVQSENVRQVNGYAGERVTAPTVSTGRLLRLAAENDLTLTLVGPTSPTNPQEADRMGAQRPDQLLTLLRECETANDGILHDGRDNGLTYITRLRRYNAGPALTLNAAAGEVVSPLSPVDDDRLNRNRVTATRKNGASYTFEDTDGPLGTATIGVYDSALTVNTNADASARQFAGWAVHKGTVEGYRFPTLSLNFAHDPALVPAWIALQLGDRIDVTGINTVRDQYPAGTQSFALEGYTQTIDQFEWTAVANCSPYQPWRVIEMAATTGDTNEFLCHLESDGSTLSSGASAGASSLSVATAAGPLWTTTADDFPFDIEVGGIKVTVTAISGGSSPQTFTVTGATVTKALSSGSAVTVWRPPVLAI